MRKLLFFIPILFTMCTSHNSNFNTVQTKNDSLQRLLNEKDSAIYTVLETFNEIENNLATIKTKERIISSTVQDVEDRRTREQKINEDINLIYVLMQENQEKVVSLQDKKGSVWKILKQGVSKVLVGEREISSREPAYKVAMK